MMEIEGFVFSRLFLHSHLMLKMLHVPLFFGVSGTMQPTHLLESHSCRPLSRFITSNLSTLFPLSMATQAGLEME